MRPETWVEVPDSGTAFYGGMRETEQWGMSLPAAYLPRDPADVLLVGRARRHPSRAAATDARRRTMGPLLAEGPMSAPVKDDSGYVVPQAVVESIRAQLARPESPHALLRLAQRDDDAPPRPLTLRQRLRLLRADVRWRIHDWLFSDCPTAGDDW